eukprot:scaffold1726_cov260-Pinguiococcus_pyrenoidosus.AAC.2
MPLPAQTSRTWMVLSSKAPEPLCKGLCDTRASESGPMYITGSSLKEGDRPHCGFQSVASQQAPVSSGTIVD